MSKAAVIFLTKEAGRDDCETGMRRKM